MSRAGLPAAALLIVLTTGCGNPRRDAAAPVDGANSAPSAEGGGEPAEVAAPGAVLEVRYTSGLRFRAVRTMRVRERTEQGVYVTEGEETSLTEVLSVDELGRLLALRRVYESSLTRFGPEGFPPDIVRGALDGAELELRRSAEGVRVSVLAGDPALADQKFLLDGFDSALLPSGEVRLGDRWTLGEADLAGLSGILAGLGFEIEKQNLVCRVAELTESQAVIGLDWRLTGSLNGRIAVLRFEGELTFDRTCGLVSAVSLAGGRTGSDGRAEKQVEIEISRRPVDGWLDLER